MSIVVCDVPDPADWIRKSWVKGSVVEAVPGGFEAYARVLHPAGFEDRAGLRPVTWGTVATLHGHEVHTDSRWDDIAESAVTAESSGASIWNRKPVEGSLSPETAGVLGRVLANHTTTPVIVWLCAWDGWAGLRWVTPGREVGLLATGRRRERVWWGDSPKTERIPLPTVQLLGREYVLLRGSIADVGQSVVEPPGWQLTNLWWPDDRSWFVSTPIDGRSTFVGGSEACIEALIRTESVEALAVQTST